VNLALAFESSVFVIMSLIMPLLPLRHPTTRYGGIYYLHETFLIESQHKVLVKCKAYSKAAIDCI